jgi:putative glutamine amidotransferase
MKKPLIGITTSKRTNPDSALEFCVAYAANARAIERAGGLPIMIPSLLDDDTLRGIYERVDAVLLPGGGDVEPSRYGAVAHPATYNIDLDRDRAEILLARWAAEGDRPLFGICRGHQVINVAFGGTLIQDIPSEIETVITHDSPNALPRHHRAHEVNIDAASRLAGILGRTTVAVNSLHHQSVQQPAPAANVIAYSPDGIVEALEFPDRRFALSVQWHPEDLVDDETAQRLFKAFVNAAREWAAR